MVQKACDSTFQEGEAGGRVGSHSLFGERGRGVGKMGKVLQRSTLDVLESLYGREAIARARIFQINEDIQLLEIGTPSPFATFKRYRSTEKRGVRFDAWYTQSHPSKTFLLYFYSASFY